MYELLFDDENASGFEAGRRTQKYIETKEVTKITSIVIRLISPPPRGYPHLFHIRYSLIFVCFLGCFLLGLWVRSAHSSFDYNAARAGSGRRDDKYPFIINKLP